MATPPSDSGLRADADGAAAASDFDKAGSWRKKLRFWRFNAPRVMDKVVPYAGPNLVVFDGTSDYLYKLSTPTNFATSQYMTFAMHFVPKDVTRLQNLLHLGAANARISLNASGKITPNFSNANFPTTYSSIIGWSPALSIDTAYTVHFAVDFVNGTLVEFINGTAPSADGGGFGIVGSSATLGSVAAAGIGGPGSATIGTTGLQANVGFIWFTAGDTTASYVTDPTKFYSGGPVNLGTDGTGSGLSKPIIFFGGNNNAAHWNAGVNAGTGADTWTSSVDVSA